MCDEKTMKDNSKTMKDKRLFYLKNRLKNRLIRSFLFNMFNLLF